MIRKKDPLTAIKPKDVHAASGSGNVYATDCLKIREYIKKMLAFYETLILSTFTDYSPRRIVAILLN